MIRMINSTIHRVVFDRDETLIDRDVTEELGRRGEPRSSLAESRKRIWKGEHTQANPGGTHMSALSVPHAGRVGGYRN